MSTVLDSSNLFWQPSHIYRTQREARNQHPGCLIWITGLPSSGKSTLAQHLEVALFNAGCSAFVLDGDNMRHGLCRDLGFSPKDRQENIRRIGEVARLFVEAGFITLAAFVSPYAADRENVRKTAGEGNYIEIYCQCPVDVCESRDPKGNYTKARTGTIAEFTGISAPYEPPEYPDLTVATNILEPKVAANKIIDLLHARGILSDTQCQSINA
jgi:adenylylsulfate kinase